MNKDEAKGELVLCNGCGCMTKRTCGKCLRERVLQEVISDMDDIWKRHSDSWRYRELKKRLGGLE